MFCSVVGDRNTRNDENRTRGYEVQCEGLKIE